MGRKVVFLATGKSKSLSNVVDPILIRWECHEEG